VLGVCSAGRQPTALGRVVLIIGRFLHTASPVRKPNSQIR
jgi:hypothetical protein